MYLQVLRSNLAYIWDIKTALWLIGTLTRLRKYEYTTVTWQLNALMIMMFVVNNILNDYPKVN